MASSMGVSKYGFNSDRSVGKPPLLTAANSFRAVNAKLANFASALSRWELIHEAYSASVTRVQSADLNQLSSESQQNSGIVSFGLVASHSRNFANRAILNSF